MKKRFEMTEEQYNKLLEASKPTPVMFMSGGTPMFSTPQENANNAWENLGMELGFDYMTVEGPDVGESNRVFYARESNAKP